MKRVFFALSVVAIAFATTGLPAAEPAPPPKLITDRDALFRKNQVLNLTIDVSKTELEKLNACFRRLHTVFDLCKLAAIWRERKVRHAILDDLATRPVARVAIPDSYSGLLVQREGFICAGGAKARPRVASKAMVTTDRLTVLLDAAERLGEARDRSVGELTLPNLLRVSR